MLEKRESIRGSQYEHFSHAGSCARVLTVVVDEATLSDPQSRQLYSQITEKCRNK